LNALHLRPKRSRRFSPEAEAQFQSQRREALAVINGNAFWMSAALVLVFSAWDWFIDPANWQTALGWRLLGIVIIISTGLIQRRSGRVDWAPVLAKVRFAAMTLAVAAALTVLKDGFLVGLAGLVAAFFTGPYIAMDRRDYLKLNATPLIAVAVLLWASGADRFVMINAACFLSLAVVVGLFLTRVFEMSNRRAFAAEQALSHEARTDALTGIANRRALDEIGLAELRRSARSGMPVSLILLDIDHFKRINDTHGHQVGDRAIQALIATLRPGLRVTDSMGRWGGEEFLVILPETPGMDAGGLAERLRVAIESAPLAANPPLNMTISLGVATMAKVNVPEDDWAALLKAADAALYRAKHEGRNRVVAA